MSEELAGNSIPLNLRHNVSGWFCTRCTSLFFGIFFAAMLFARVLRAEVFECVTKSASSGRL